MALARYESVAVNLAGDVIPNATVEVRRDQPGRPVVPLFSDREGTIALGNPITTDSEGKFGFHVPGGVYYIRVFTGPSQQPLQQYVRRYQAIGTAAERDVEDLASALEAGTATFPTLAELEAFTPSVEGVGGKVTSGEDAGFYHYDDLGEVWVFDRPLFDSLARMNVTGGTADDIEAETAAGVADSSVVMLWIEAPGDNTGAVTINGKEVLTASGNSLIAGQWNEGRTYWFSDEGANYKLRTESDIDGIATQVEIWANETLANKSYAEEWAQSDDPISVDAGGDGAHDKSSKTWAGESEAFAALAAGYAAGVNLPAIDAGDAGKQLFVTDEEDGYELRDAPLGGFPSRAWAIASFHPATAPDGLRTDGYASAGDGGGALYRKVVSEPSHAGKFSITLADAVTVVWYEIAEQKPNLRMFGAIPGVDDAPSAAANAAAVEAAIAYGSYFEGTPETYYFGTWTGNTYLFTTDHALAIDWKGAHIIVDGDDTVGTTSTYFIVADDARLSMQNYEFTDRSYDIEAPGTYRGVGPVGIVNDAANTSGYSFGNFIIHKGQSLLTVASLNPSTARASDISFFGNCQGVETYYGVNLANNGDGFQGDYKLGEVDRAWFLYGVKGFQARVQVATGKPSSANGLISYRNRKTEDITIDAIFGTIDGPFRITNDPATSSAPEFENINLRISIDTAGSNIGTNFPPIRISELDGGGSAKSTGTLAIKGLAIDLFSKPQFVRALDCETATPNIAPIRLQTNLPLQRTIGKNTSITTVRGAADEIAAAIVGTANSVILRLPVSSLRQGPAALRGIMSVRIDSYGSPSPPSGGRCVMAEYAVRFSLDSLGAVSIITPEQIWQKNYGSITPTLVVSANGGSITITATGMGADSTLMEIEASIRLLN